MALLASLGSLFLPSAFGEGTKQIIAGTFFAAFLLAVIFRRRKPMVTPLSSFHVVDLPCPISELDKAIDIARFYFRQEAMRPEVVRIAHSKNPYCVIPVKNGEGSVIGYADIFGIREDVFRDIIKGSKTERMLLASDVLSLDETRRGKRVYIGGIAVKSDKHFEAHRTTAELVYCIGDVLLKRYMENEGDPWEVYALGSSKEGRQLLERLGFGIRQEGKQRADKVPLYYRQVRRTDVVRLQREWPVDRAKLVLRYKADAGRRKVEDRSPQLAQAPNGD